MTNSDVITAEQAASDAQRALKNHKLPPEFNITIDDSTPEAIDKALALVVLGSRHHSSSNA